MTFEEWWNKYSEHINPNDFTTIRIFAKSQWDYQQENIESNKRIIDHLSDDCKNLELLNNKYSEEMFDLRIKLSIAIKALEKIHLQDSDNNRGFGKICLEALEKIR